MCVTRKRVVEEERMSKPTVNVRERERKRERERFFGFLLKGERMFVCFFVECAFVPF